MFLVGILCAVSSLAQEHIEKNYTLYFRVNKSDIDQTYMGNDHTIETMVNDIQTTLEMKGVVPDSLLIYASASPEGPAALNRRLAIDRAESARAFILDLFPQFNPENIKVESRANDWSGLILALRRDTTITHKETLMRILTNPDIHNKTAALRAVPEAYDEIRDGALNYMRTATVTISVIGKYDEFAERKPLSSPEVSEIEEVQAIAQKTPVSPLMQRPVHEVLPPFYMAVKTNMLYDAALVPNIGVEFYLGKNFSLAGNWMYSWWKSDPKAWYWRTYGGDLTARYWFGKAAERKPLTGHHVGVYGQIVTYDFEVGGRGYLGDRWSYGAGVEYGYSLPIARRLNIDFNVGFGYLGGEFKEYLPIDGHYVWQVTKYRHMFGPTKAEISLVWLLGRGNYNKNKGNNRR